MCFGDVAQPAGAQIVQVWNQSDLDFGKGVMLSFSGFSNHLEHFPKCPSIVFFSRQNVLGYPPKVSLIKKNIAF